MSLMTVQTDGNGTLNVMTLQPVTFKDTTLYIYVGSVMIDDTPNKGFVAIKSVTNGDHPEIVPKIESTDKVHLINGCSELNFVRWIGSGTELKFASRIDNGNFLISGLSDDLEGFAALVKWDEETLSVLEIEVYDTIKEVTHISNFTNDPDSRYLVVGNAIDANDRKIPVVTTIGEDLTAQRAVYLPCDEGQLVVVDVNVSGDLLYVGTNVFTPECNLAGPGTITIMTPLLETQRSITLPSKDDRLFGFDMISPLAIKAYYEKINTGKISSMYYQS